MKLIAIIVTLILRSVGAVILHPPCENGTTICENIKVDISSHCDWVNERDHYFREHCQKTCSEFCPEGQTCMDTGDCYLPENLPCTYFSDRYAELQEHCSKVCGFCQVMCPERECQNGATCSEDQGSFECLCAPGFGGEYCEKACSDISMFNCSSGDVCIAAENACDGVANCPDGSDESSYGCAYCPPGGGFVQHDCVSGIECLPWIYKCDFIADCPDQSDEEDCTCEDHPAPPSEKFQCSSGGCINITWVCDNTVDCFNDESDEEQDCPYPGEQTGICKEQGIANEPCRGVVGSNYECRPLTWNCDYIADCPDKTDEIHCQPCDQSKNEFGCSNGGCINGEWVCNGEVDCFNDSSDEENCG